ncbi:type II toxin-antitoxin system VapC family toxin [Mycobacterium celatum]|uniref:Ribonuclease VapC n=1 Tax=Mycobacterium celatum TaxID=28045 RepID=A0A1X1RLC1_MYCCE|nr:type II toxin-antitoxin system VapC family toxin [Mycobacterium celatum]ORV08574.1 ribonuclease [Mycobacterium celatum]PIB78333.1 PIN domain-containing protein [Mycobacterium celatum]
MIVLDTTVLVYAKGADHPLRDPCRELVMAIADEDIEATTTAEVIQEFVHVRARRRGRNDAVTLGRDYVELLSPLLTITRDQLRRGLTLFETTPRLGAFDAVLAASVAETGATALVSADTAFCDVPDITHIVPDADGVRRLLEKP